MRVLLVMIALLGASAASAQNVAIDENYIHACHASVPQGARQIECLGQAANICQQTTPGGQTTPGIADCIMAETAIWDNILNAEYGKTRDQLRQLDVAEPPLAGARDIALRDAQRAWIAFRDAECGLAYARWQGGSIRTIVAANCSLTMTAERAIALRDMRWEDG